MLRAVLFDLDNTLIRFSERLFFESYLAQVPKAFADIMPADTFVEKLLSSTQALMLNTGEMLNADYFRDLFSVGYEERRDELWSRFMTFYETEYDQFKAIMSTSPGVKEVFLRLRDNGVKLVIASNPIWPLNVQMKRLSWAGLEDIEFDLVTHIGNMSFCKPHIEYYQEVCQKIDDSPEACLMVGNDPVNDMVVSKIGMRTYLVTEGATDDAALELSRSVRTETPGEIPAPDFKGPLSRVPDAVETLIIK